MSVQHEKYEFAVLSQIITQTFGDFRPCRRPGGSSSAISVLSAASNGNSGTFFILGSTLTATFRRFSHPLPPSRQTFGDFRSCRRLSDRPGSKRSRLGPCPEPHARKSFDAYTRGPVFYSPRPLTEPWKHPSARKEAAWGRRRPLGRGTCALKGTCAWGALC